MSWWCSASRQTWTWAWKPYLGSFLIVGSIMALALWWNFWGRRSDEIEAARTTSGATTEIEGSSTGRTVAFGVAIVGLWAVIDWPLAALGAGYLATAQMTRQILMVMVVAPLMLFACPPALAVRVVGWGKGLTVLRWWSRPVVAVPLAAGSLLIANIPVVVVPLVQTPYGSFLMDGLWTLAGFTLWMPVQCPHPGVRRLTGAVAIMYLIGQSIVPVLPGFFMTWAYYPIYSTYELAPRVFAGFDAVNDQQAAAAILQVGGMVLLWIQISYRFLKWGYEQVALDRPLRKSVSDRGVAPS